MILSWSSAKPSICGVALSWKYKPQGLGASHKSLELLYPNNKAKITIILGIIKGIRS